MLTQRLARRAGLGTALLAGVLTAAFTAGTPVTLSSPMQLGWLAPTNQGAMVGDYISTSFLAGQQRVIGVFATASAPFSNGHLDEPMFAGLEQIHRGTNRTTTTTAPTVNTGIANTASTAF